MSAERIYLDNTNIWWEDLKNVRGIIEGELTWDEFEKLFINKYLYERYYDNKENKFYKLKMGQMADEEYITKFLQLLRYMQYLKDEKVKIQWFISGLPLAFKDWTKILEPQKFNDDMKKLKHCYE